MKKNVFVVLGLVMSVACASLPAPRQIQNAWQIDRSFDDVWQAAIESVPEMGLAIDKAQIETGLITTTETNLPEGTSKQYADWGKLSFSQFQQGFQGTFNIYVREIDEAKAELKMIPVYKVVFSDSMEHSKGEKGLWTRPAVSTGKMEAEFYDRVMTKLE